jgi:phage/plasmid-like protein (TIGR03299 family)
MANVSVRPSEARQSSWNLMGKDISDCGSIGDAIEKAELNFVVDSEPLLRVPQSVIDAIRAGENIDFSPSLENIVTSHKSTYRTDNGSVLGVVGRDYSIVDNSKAFEFINFIEEVSGEKPILETAGSLGYGERIFVSCRLGEDCYLNGSTDAVKKYVLFTNSHDGSGSVMAFFTPVRVICQNTLNMAIRGAVNKVMFKHTKNVNKRLDWEIEENRKKALEVFRRSVEFSKTFIDRMLMLKNETLTTEEIRDITHKMYLTPSQFDLFSKNDFKLDGIDEISTRTKNNILAFKDALDFGIGQEMYRGTKLWMLNGITTMMQNEREWKTDEDKFNSIMGGDVAKKTQKMYDLLLAA